MRAKALHVLITLFACVGAFLLGKELRPEPPPPVPPAERCVTRDELRAELQAQAHALRSSMSMRPGDTPQAPPAVDLGSVRSAVREEFEQETARRETPRPPADPQAHANAVELVRQALERRRWTDEEVRTFRTLLPGMSADQRSELMLQLMRAVNEGRLVVEASGPPF